MDGQKALQMREDWASSLNYQAVGVPGLMYQTVAARTHQTGVRMAPGAQSGNVMGMVIRPGLLLTGVGVTLGMIGSLE
jgi:putative ABC transport system permease protein